MAAKAGVVTIDVAANISKLVKGMNDAESRTKKAFSVMKKAAFGFAAILGSRALISTLKQTASEIDNIGKTASRLGIATDALIGLRHAADQSGVSVQTLEMSMQRMTRRVEQDSKSAQEALNQMNMSFIEFKNLSLEEQMNAVADGLNGIESQSERVSIAFKLFDSEGVKVLNMLQGGSQALKDYKQEADKLGITLSTSMVKAVEDANDELDKVGKLATTVKNVITVGLAPAITTLASAFVETATDGKSFETMLKGVQDTVVKIVGAFESFYRVIVLSFEGLAGAFAYVKLKFYEFTGQTKNAKEALDDFEETTTRVNGAWNSLALAIDGNSQLQIDLRAAMEKSNKEFKNGLSYIGDYEKGLKKLNPTLEDLAKTIGDTFGSNLNKAFRDLLDNAFSFKDAMKGLIKDIIADIIRLTVVQQAAGFVTGAILGTPAETAGSRSSGGAVTAGRSYLVGENGAEMFTPSLSGSISSNNSTNVNIINNSSANIETKENDQGIDVIISDIETALADGVSRRTSPLADAILGLR